MHPLTLPSAPAQIHHPALSLTPNEAARARLAVRMTTLGSALVVGALTLIPLCLSDSTSTFVAIPAAWVVGLGAAWLAGERAVQRGAIVDDAAVARARALLFFGIALLGPLTLHLIIQAPRWAPGPYDALADRDRSFTRWVMLSGYLTGLSHVVFATLSAWRGWRGRSDGPRLWVIGVAATVGTMPAFLMYGAFGALPMLYVALTATVILRVLRRIERASV